MKKILFILPSITQTNGVSAFIKNYIEFMDCSDLKVDILCSDKRPSSDYINFFKKNGIKINFLPQYKKEGFVKYIRCIYSFYKKAGRYDLIYSNVAYQSFIYFFFAIINGNRKFAIHSHATQASENVFKKIIGSVMQFMNNRIAKYKLACSILAGKAMFKNDKFIVVHNAIDYSKYAFNIKCRDEIRKKLNISETCLLIGFVGRYMKQKNIYFFMELAKRLQENEKILMIGSGDMQEEFINKIKEEKLHKYFVFIDECNNVNEYYSAMDVFLLPSLYEGLPVTAIEAQANGLPCILSKNITEETKISNNTFFYDIANVDSWCMKIRNVKRIPNSNISNDYDIRTQAIIFKNMIVDFCGETDERIND